MTKRGGGKQNRMKIEKNTSIHEFAFDRIEGDRAVLISDDKIELILPKKMLPTDAKEGSVLSISISTDELETKKREKTAKELLNEILNVQK